MPKKPMARTLEQFMATHDATILPFWYTNTDNLLLSWDRASSASASESVPKYKDRLELLVDYQVYLFFLLWLLHLSWIYTSL